MSTRGALMAKLGKVEVELNVDTSGFEALLRRLDAAELAEACGAQLELWQRELIEKICGAYAVPRELMEGRNKRFNILVDIQEEPMPEMIEATRFGSDVVEYVEGLRVTNATVLEYHEEPSGPELCATRTGREVVALDLRGLSDDLQKRGRMLGELFKRGAVERGELEAQARTLGFKIIYGADPREVICGDCQHRWVPEITKVSLEKHMEDCPCAPAAEVGALVAFRDPSFSFAVAGTHEVLEVRDLGPEASRLRMQVRLSCDPRSWFAAKLLKRVGKAARSGTCEGCGGRFDASELKYHRKGCGGYRRAIAPGALVIFRQETPADLRAPAGIHRVLEVQRLHSNPPEVRLMYFAGAALADGEVVDSRGSEVESYAWYPASLLDRVGTSGLARVVATAVDGHEAEIKRLRESGEISADEAHELTYRFIKKSIGHEFRPGGPDEAYLDPDGCAHTTEDGPCSFPREAHESLGSGLAKRSDLRAPRRPRQPRSETTSWDPEGGPRDDDWRSR